MERKESGSNKKRNQSKINYENTALQEKLIAEFLKIFLRWNCDNIPHDENHYKINSLVKMAKKKKKGLMHQ